MVSFEILIEIHPTKRTEFLQAFEMIESDGSHANERLEIGLFEQANCANTFLWKEHWENHELLQQYFKSISFRMMVGAINILGRLVHKKVCN
ncbi:MAG: hypothetical protein HKP44_15735 [Desulfofustis sp.]|nr:hypothetical protein [Desulfofustis sp.]